MSNNARVSAVKVAKEETVLVPGALLLFLSSESAEPHLNLRLPHRDLMAGVVSALRRDAEGDVCVADRFVPALEYADNPAHAFAMFAHHLSNVARGVDEPVAPAECPVNVGRTAEWYALPLFFFASYSQISEIKDGVVDLGAKTIEVIDATLRAIIGSALSALQFPPIVMHRALVPALIEEKTAAAIRAVAKQGKLHKIPSPLSDEVFQMARWPMYLTMPTEDYQSRPVPEVRLPRDIDPEMAGRIQAAGWQVRFPKVLRLVH